MKEELLKITVRVPAGSIGEALGELNHRLSLIDDMKNKDGVCTVQVRVPVEEFASFKRWLEKFTNGKGDAFPASEGSSMETGTPQIDPVP